MSKRGRRRNPKKNDRKKEPDSSFGPMLEAPGDTAVEEEKADGAGEDLAGDDFRMTGAEAGVVLENKVKIDGDDRRLRGAGIEDKATENKLATDERRDIDNGEAFSGEMIPQIRMVYSDPNSKEEHALEEDALEEDALEEDALEEDAREEEAREETEERAEGFKNLAELFQNISVEKSDPVVYIDKPELPESAEAAAVSPKVAGTLSQEDLANLTMKDQKPFKSDAYYGYDGGLYTTTVIYKDNADRKAGWFGSIMKSLGKAFCCYAR
jgi:hypothetical protein